MLNWKLDAPRKVTSSPIESSNQFMKKKMKAGCAVQRCTNVRCLEKTYGINDE